ncbi:GL27182 [Drosophila persimilis]|uniref:Fatty acyl-CoA reductase n=1 Tax=Drosophila persimilis TaxID=7234 RepID=B4GZ53_DROPE|nr:fatty acyl-CoA reductase wat [Drosophila persimilis]EDW28071.1 GL27182 [Drosophila persimilis]
METEVQRFYRDKTIFVTGGTGFLGKVIIEKILRATDPKKIYFLVRSKKNEDVRTRVTQWLSQPIFESLLKIKPTVLQRMTPIVGDCLEPDLGISEADRKMLAKEVQIVIHGAATVRFNEDMHMALAINTRATRLMLQLAKEMHSLEAFVQISTAYSNCVIDSINEEFYPQHLTCSADTVLRLRETVSAELLDNMTPALLGKYPNTYTYTKALAEQVIQEEAGDLPVCIFRPAIIYANYKEPSSGWIDNPYGLVALIYGITYGVLHILLCNIKAQAVLVPGDYCANLAVASAWETAKKAKTKSALTAIKPKPTIYNFAPCRTNTIDWNDFRNKGMFYGKQVPIRQMIWYPFVHSTTCPWLFRICSIFYHYIPGYFFDLILRLSGKKPRLVKAYRKAHANVEALFFFNRKTFWFNRDNTEALWDHMSPEDRKGFNFDMKSLDWDDYFKNIWGGMRLYIFKEPATAASLADGIRVLFRYRVLHSIGQVLLGSGAAYVLWLLFTIWQ